MNTEAAYVALAEALGPRTPYLWPLLRQFKTPEAVFAAEKTVLSAALPEAGGAVEEIVSGRAAEKAAAILAYCKKHGVGILTPHAAAYPKKLRVMEDAPVVLYVKGTLPDFDRVPTVGMVGTRHPDGYGARNAYRIAYELAVSDVVTVSGMAAGVDGIAAAGSIDGGGRTVAILGCGIDVVYPNHHGKLMADILKNGAVLTEYPPGTRPDGWHFPVRNRLISALSDALTVVEAGDGSGALITAKYALLQDKPLFVLPGEVDSIMSRGSNRLLLGPAAVLLQTEQILTSLAERSAGVFHPVIPILRDESSLLTKEKLAAHGIPAEGFLPTAEKPRGIFGKREKSAPKKEKTKEKNRKKDEEATGKTAASPLDEREKEEALALLSPKEKEIYLSLPLGNFGPDILTDRGISAGAAASFLTLFELYGLLSPLPGGFYVKK